MSDQKTFTERAAAIRDKAADVEAAPVFTKMKLAQDIAMEAALLVADMAERLDATTPYIDEVRERFDSEAG
tara:strand:+ start:246 stop:458 length:213 start_codon:yes stop_codon:yes gene_type:complete